MKRYRFFFRGAAIPAAKFAHGYSGAKLSQYLNDFRPRAERYRRRKLIGASLVDAFILGIVVLSIAHSAGVRDVVLLVACALLVIGAIISCFILVFGMKLVCPACRNRLEPAKGLYCTVCGSDQFQYGSQTRGEKWAGYVGYVYCPSCDSTIDEGVATCLAATGSGDAPIVV